jgi:drug/metabolite transporter (DMT)-like permease
MAKILIILVIAFAFEAFGVIALKKGIDQITIKYHERQAATPFWKNVLKLVGNWFANKHIWLGLLLETIFFVCLLYLLGQRDVSFIWPLTSLSFVMTTLAAQFFLHEKVTTVRWGGVVLIMIGAALISYSEHTKDRPTAAAAASAPGGVKTP